MKDDPHWVDVSRLMQEGLVPAIQPFLGTPQVGKYIERLNRILQIKDVDLHVEEVTGEDKTTAVVVDIFNQVNSGGTKLSEGDLALARLCVDWPEAKDRIREQLEYWRSAGFHFRPEWLLRNVTAIVTGQAFFSALRTQGTHELQEGLAQAERAINHVLNLVSARLGLDHDRVLGGRYAFPAMTRFVVQRNYHLDAAEQGKLLYWYVHSFL